MNAVVVLGRTYRVIIEELEEDTLGECRFPQGVIAIDPGADFESTLIHEVAHAILYESGLSNLIERNLEEAIVMAMESGFSRANLFKG